MLQVERVLAGVIGGSALAQDSLEVVAVVLIHASGDVSEGKVAGKKWAFNVVLQNQTPPLAARKGKWGRRLPASRESKGWCGGRRLLVDCRARVSVVDCVLDGPWSFSEIVGTVSVVLMAEPAATCGLGRGGIRFFEAGTGGFLGHGGDFGMGSAEGRLTEAASTVRAGLLQPRPRRRMGATKRTQGYCRGFSAGSEEALETTSLRRAPE